MESPKDLFGEHEAKEPSSSAAARAVKCISDRAEGLTAFLNGIAGDYIADRKSHLATPMAFYKDGEPLALAPDELQNRLERISPVVCVFLHGLCCTEKVFSFGNNPNNNYGEMLQRELGITPLFVRYNSGLHISQNGKMLSSLLEELVAAYPIPIKEFVLVGHSQGGLIIRSACYQAHKEEITWAKKVSRTFLLAPPQEGSWLEKNVNALCAILKASKLAPLKFIAGFLDHRSAAIKDLRHGYLLDEQWQSHAPGAVFAKAQRPVPWLAGAAHHVIAGTLTKDPGHVLSLLLGDSLVRIPSARGKKMSGLSNGPVRWHLVAGTGHMALARSLDVYRIIFESLVPREVSPGMPSGAFFRNDPVAPFIESASNPS
ncbi:MAG: alpha/beta fold hydrolase [Desulfatibacillaceae bacterium]|nr:alpha/beta fold hydrolase [Desulfatibacillaceae bacterium]